MAIEKKGAVEKIAVKAVNKSEFESMFKMIDDENKLVKCPACNRLLSKVAAEGKTIQYKGSQAIVKEGKIMMRCTTCGKVVEF
jgi:uncharacterized protein with PIN domain